MESINNKLNKFSENKNELDLKINKLETNLDALFALVAKIEQNLTSPPSLPPLAPSNKFSRSLTTLNNINIEMDVTIKPVQKDHDSKHEKKIKIIYPKTKIYRGLVPSSKKSWNVSYDNYMPVKYTSKEVILNTNADIDLLSIK